MADDTSTDDTQADDASATDDVTQQDGNLGDQGKKALTEERRHRRAAEKAHNDALARLKEYEDRDKTDQQKLEERATAAERAAETASRELSRIRAAKAAGLDMEDADLITGSTDAEMKASAERLAERFGAASTRTNYDGGARTPAGRPADMNDLIRRSVGR